jgi:hypothetical protein
MACVDAGKKKGSASQKRFSISSFFVLFVFDHPPPPPG